MLVPWLGFVDSILLKSTREVATDGPPSLTSSEYAEDLNEVKSFGSATSTTRTAAQTATAHFWNVNIANQMQAAMRGLITAKKLSIRDAAKLFALTNVSAGDAAISCWREKFDYGFWRPSTAIHEADKDGNAATTQDTAWLPLFADPPYPEYPSGHACATSAHIKAMRLFAGTDAVTLTVPSFTTGVADRTYTSLNALRDEAFHARIWLGIHFRFSMEASTEIGFDTAKIVYRRLLDDDRLDDVKVPKPPKPTVPPVDDDDDDADDDEDDDDNGDDNGDDDAEDDD